LEGESDKKRKVSESDLLRELKKNDVHSNVERCVGLKKNLSAALAGPKKRTYSDPAGNQRDKQHEGKKEALSQRRRGKLMGDVYVPGGGGKQTGLTRNLDLNGEQCHRKSIYI